MMNVHHELAESGVRATVYCPSTVATGMRENNARYRPDRFGGPGEGAVQTPEQVRQMYKDTARVSHEPEQVAAIVLSGVRADRMIVFNSTQDRKTFLETYVEPVMAAFDRMPDSVR
jgi:short-subunit dehydrogenase